MLDRAFREAAGGTVSACRCVAIVPARDAASTLVATLESLRLGNAPFVERVLVVTSTGDPTATLVRNWSQRDSCVQLVELERPATAGAARNAGRDAAGDAGLLLFVDADCRLEVGGAAELARELEASAAAAVSARVVREGGLVSRVRHALEFKEAASLRPPPRDWLPPTTTMLCRGEAFERVGGFPDLWPGEDLVFAARLREEGLRVQRSAAVRTVHRHPPGFVAMLRHQHRLGLTSAQARHMADLPGSPLARRPALAPLLFPARVLRLLAWQAGEGPRAFVWTIALLAPLLAGLACWTAGFVAGAARGPSRCGFDGRGAPRRPAGEHSPASTKVGASEGPRRVVAVVPLFNGEALIESCLDALLATHAIPSQGSSSQEIVGGGLECEVLVVDNGSRDSGVAVARRVAARARGRVRVVELGSNHGFAGGVNRAIATLRGADAAGRGRALGGHDIVALVNQDCVVAPGWLGPLARALDDPSVAVVGARLLEGDGVTLQHAGARVEANGLTSHFGRGSRDPCAHRDPRDVDYVCAALAAFRMETWHRFGPFDEGYAPAYFEEVDFCVRVREAGLRVVYVPESEARHLEAASSGAGSALFLRRYHASRMRFVARHLLVRGKAWHWLRAEGAWLFRLRRRADLVPVLRSYATLPRLLREVRVGAAEGMR